MANGRTDFNPGINMMDRVRGTDFEEETEERKA
jgi:hypothetical protein